VIEIAVAAALSGSVLGGIVLAVGTHIDDNQIRAAPGESA